MRLMTSRMMKPTIPMPPPPKPPPPEPRRSSTSSLSPPGVQSMIYLTPSSHGTAVPICYPPKTDAETQVLTAPRSERVSRDFDRCRHHHRERYLSRAARDDGRSRLISRGLFG